MTKSEDYAGLPNTTDSRNDRERHHASTLRDGVVGFAAVTAAILFTLRLAVDAPLTIPGASAAALLEGLSPGVTAVLGLTAVALGVTHSRVVHPTALAVIAVGVFGVLTLASDAAVLPAVGVVAIAGVVALEPWTASTKRSAAVLPAGSLALGLVLAVSATAGIGPLVGRTIGIPLLLAGFALTPLAMENRTRTDLVAGAAVTAGIVTVGLAAPFVTAAATVSLLGVAGVPVVLLALAMGGLAATASAAIAGGHWSSLAGVVLLAAAGAPVSIGRGLALVLGGVLVLGTLTDQAEVTSDG